MITPDIAALIEACAWFPSRFLVISENVFSPLLYYSYFGTMIPMLFIGFFVLQQDRRQLENKLLFLVSGSFAIWVFGAMVVWATELPKLTMFFWSILGLVEPFIYFFTFYFAFVFMFGKDLSTKQKVLFALPLVPTILLTPTHFMLLGYDLSNCDRNAYEGIATSYGYLIEILYTASIVVCAWLARRRSTSPASRRQITLLAVGCVAFLLSFSLGNILEVFTENWYIGQYGLFGAPIFVGLLAYLIVRYKALNAKLFGAQALVLTLLLVIGSIVFARNMSDVYLILGPSVVLTVIAGNYLIHSVRREILQREHLEQLSHELSSANDRLKELDHLKSQFLSFASHQLKAPMTSVKWNASLIADGTLGKVPEKVSAKAREMEGVVDRLVGLVDEFLNLRKLEEGRMEFKFEPLDVSVVTQKVVADLDALAQRKGLVLTFTANTHTQAMIDQQKFVQVIQNLIDNAIKYTDKGTVAVLVDTDTAGDVVISVKDTGHGMSGELIPKLFDQFVRGPNDAKLIEGTGLGLYIAKQIVIAHKGKIWATSDGPGKGSTFAVEIPHL